MKLLVAIDFSLHSHHVLDEIAHRPWPTATEVCVLHVIDWPHWASNASVHEALQRSAERLVELGCATLRGSQLHATAKVLEGHPREAIAHHAESWGANLILMGSHGTSAVGRLVLGSVAHATLRRAPCSVEIIRPKELRAMNGMKILVGTDGSECSAAALKTVATRPWPTGSQVRVVSAIPFVSLPVEMVAPVVAIVPPPENIITELEKEGALEAQNAINGAREILGPLLTAEPDRIRMPHGDARGILVSRAKEWEADLIVLGSHGYGAIDRLILGSVSEYVAMHAPCAVEVVR